MITILGRVEKVGDSNFVKVVHPDQEGIYVSGQRVLLAHLPQELGKVQGFRIVDGKAYPAEGAVSAEVKSDKVDSRSPIRWGWQQEALIRWEKAGRVGIIEAVTGSGKTFLAMEALEQQWKRYPLTYALVVVPSITLQEQWHQRLTKKFPGTRLARLGGSYNETFAQGKICIAVVNSVVGVGRSAPHARLLSLFEHCRRFPENRSFLIADECHHYINADVFKRVRTLMTYDAVLALSATVGAFFEVDGLGKIVYTYTFADAVRRGDLPPLTLLNVKCRLHTDERQKYDELSEAIRFQISQVCLLFEDELDEDEPISDDFWNCLKQLDRAAGPDGEPAIRKLMVLLYRRSAILYQSREKQSAACELIRGILLNPRRRKVIVFFERIASAEDSADRVELEVARACQYEVANRDLWTDVLHSGLNSSDRQRVIQEFRASPRAVLFACRMLDEGFDVPDVDAAVLVASTKSKRQRVQRIGRVLRRGDGQKQPVVLTLFCEQTTDRFVVTHDRELFGEDTKIETLTLAQALAFLLQ